MGDRERITDRMRLDFSRVRRAAATLALVALAAAGCGRNSGNVPSDFTPSGSGGDNLLTVELVNDTAGGQSPYVRLRIYDRSLANGYSNYRKLPGQGFEQVAHDPYRFDGTLNQRVETFEAIDRDWQPDRQVDYLARGEFGGVETAVSPTTNQATMPGTSSPESLAVQDIPIVCPLSTLAFTAKVDSTPVLVWAPVPGAVRYLLHITRLDNHLFFYGFTPPDGSHSYQLGSGFGDVFHENTLTLKSLFYWTVEALDGNSRIIGRSEKQNFEVRTIAQADSLIFCSP
jgi:hypothetical protein